MTEIVYKDESYAIIGACFEVYNEMGTGGVARQLWSTSTPPVRTHCKMSCCFFIRAIRAIRGLLKNDHGIYQNNGCVLILQVFNVRWP